MKIVKLYGLRGGPENPGSPGLWQIREGVLLVGEAQLGWGGVTCKQPRKHKVQAPGTAVLCRAFLHLFGACLGEVAPKAVAHCLEQSTDPSHPRVGPQSISLLRDALKQTL